MDTGRDPNFTKEILALKKIITHEAMGIKYTDRCNARNSNGQCIHDREDHPLSDTGKKRHFDGKYYWGGY